MQKWRLQCVIGGPVHLIIQHHMSVTGKDCESCSDLGQLLVWWVTVCGVCMCRGVVCVFACIFVCVCVYASVLGGYVCMVYVSACTRICVCVCVCVPVFVFCECVLFLCECGCMHVFLCPCFFLCVCVCVAGGWMWGWGLCVHALLINCVCVCVCMCMCWVLFKGPRNVAVSRFTCTCLFCTDPAHQLWPQLDGRSFQHPEGRDHQAVSSEQAAAEADVHHWKSVPWALCLLDRQGCADCHGEGCWRKQQTEIEEWLKTGCFRGPWYHFGGIQVGWWGCGGGGGSVCMRVCVCVHACISVYGSVSLTVGLFDWLLAAVCVVIDLLINLFHITVLCS